MFSALLDDWLTANHAGIAERLIDEGLMRPAGRAEIDRAKADGRWELAYAGQRTAQPPQDFLDALAENPVAMPSSGR